jgi:hypothetical protein
LLVGGLDVGAAVVGAAVVGWVVVGFVVGWLPPPLQDAPLMTQLTGGLAPLPFMPQVKLAPAASVLAQDLLVTV